MSISRRSLLRGRMADRPLLAPVDIGRSCLVHAGVYCRSCVDSCPDGALAATPKPGGRVEITVAADRCSSCGACVSACPASAVSLTVSAAPVHV